MRKISLIILVAISLSIGAFYLVAPRQAALAQGTNFNIGEEAPTTEHYCGSGSSRVRVSIDFGCREKGNGFLDLTFALLRVLSIGVGIVVIGSVAYGGIMYTMSGGDPNATAKAIGRIKSAGAALLLYIFAYALLNYIIPNGILQ